MNIKLNSYLILLVGSLLLTFGCSDNLVNIDSSSRGHLLGIKQSAKTLEKGCKVGVSRSCIRSNDVVSSSTYKVDDTFGSESHNEYEEKYYTSNEISPTLTSIFFVYALKNNIDLEIGIGTGDLKTDDANLFENTESNSNYQSNTNSQTAITTYNIGMKYRLNDIKSKDIFSIYTSYNYLNFESIDEKSCDIDLDIRRYDAKSHEFNLAFLYGYHVSDMFTPSITVFTKKILSSRKENYHPYNSDFDNLTNIGIETSLEFDFDTFNFLVGAGIEDSVNIDNDSYYDEALYGFAKVGVKLGRTKNNTK